MRAFDRHIYICTWSILKIASIRYTFQFQSLFRSVTTAKKIKINQTRISNDVGLHDRPGAEFEPETVRVTAARLHFAICFTILRASCAPYSRRRKETICTRLTQLRTFY